MRLIEGHVELQRLRERRGCLAVLPEVVCHHSGRGDIILLLEVLSCHLRPVQFTLVAGFCTQPSEQALDFGKQVDNGEDEPPLVGMGVRVRPSLATGYVAVFQIHLQVESHVSGKSSDGVDWGQLPKVREAVHTAPFCEPFPELHLREPVRLFLEIKLDEVLLSIIVRALSISEVLDRESVHGRRGIPPNAMSSSNTSRASPRYLSTVYGGGVAVRSLQQGSVDAESLARRVTNLSFSLTFSRLILPKSDGEGGRLPSKIRWTGGDGGESGLRSMLGTILMGEAMWMLGSARAEENGRRWDGE